MSYRIMGLEPQPFQPLFGLSAEALAQRGVIRVVADAAPGFPCRITLEDARPGETLLLLNYEHLPVDTPYRSAHAIFVRENARKRYDAVDAMPPVFAPRMLSIRSFDDAGSMLDADLVAGAEAQTLVERFFENSAAAYLHVHYAKRGCFAARVERA